VDAVAAANRFATIVHDASASQLSGILSKAATDNIGYVYVTDDGADGNPYDSLPSYWSAEVAAVTVPEPTACGFAVIGVVQLARRRGGTSCGLTTRTDAAQSASARTSAGHVP